MKKEISIEMCKLDVDNFLSTHSRIAVYKEGHTAGNGRPIKGTLILEIPEKPIQLTESEFDDAMAEAFMDTHYYHEGFERIKQKLFNKE